MHVSLTLRRPVGVYTMMVYTEGERSDNSLLLASSAWTDTWKYYVDFACLNLELAHGAGSSINLWDSVS